MIRRNYLLLGLMLLAGSASLHAQGIDERGIIASASELDQAIDDKNWKRARELLLMEVTLVMPGREPEVLSADALIARWKAHLHAGKNSFHLRGSEAVTFDGADSAILRSKAQVWYEVPGIDGDDVFEFWADYVHELDRREDGWRVRRIGYIPRLERGNLAVRDHRTPVAETNDDKTAGAAGAGEKGSSDGSDEPGADSGENPDAERAADKDDAQGSTESAADGQNGAVGKATTNDSDSGTAAATDEQ